MGLGNIFVMALLLYYTGYFTNLFIFGQYKGLQQSNIQLTNLRKKTIKTLAEQKAFLNIKYPKKVKKKRKFKDYFYIGLFILYIVCMAMFYNFIFKMLHIDINFWIGLLIVSISPFLINLLLSRWKLDQNDLLNIIKKK
jgi:hypothetical protein